MSDRRAALLVETSRGLAFVGAEVVERVAQVGPLTAMPGLAAPAEGVALVEGRIVVVIRIGHARGEPGIVCDVGGDRVCLVGGRPVASGAFERCDGGVLHGGEPVAELDVAALHAEVEAALWAARTLERARRRASNPPPPAVVDDDARGDT